MPDTVQLNDVSFSSVEVTEKTTWTFAEITDVDGLNATVEITSGENAPEVAKLLAEFIEKLKDKRVDDEQSIEDLFGLTTGGLQSDRALATAVSGLRSAVIDLQAQKANQSITEFLSGSNKEYVTLYGNINRHLLTRDRSPQSFARAAEFAVSNGFTTLKCAPFDEIRPPSTREQILEIARPGIQRVAAVREAAGPDVTVFVDCHSRFEAHTALLIAEELARLNVGWFEEPLAPVEEDEALATLTQQISMPMAGGESGYGDEFFAHLIESKAVNVIMPDIKYCGGVGVALRSGRHALANGGRVSLHSPSGPISLLASAHATAAIDGGMPLEHAVYEADWRAELISPAEVVKDGKLWFPRGIGLGASLNQEVISKRGTQWKP